MASRLALPLARASRVGGGVGAVGSHAHGATRATRTVLVHSAVTGNGDFGVDQMELSTINKAILAMESDYAGDNASAVASVIAEFKVAQAAHKGQNASLFAGFLALAGDGATPYTLTKVGATIRANVTREMRVAQGLSAIKAKGEKGGPDFSTASVYAGIVAAAVDARRTDAESWEEAMEAIDSAKDAGEPVHEASGLFAGKGALQRAVAEYAKVRHAKEPDQFAPSQVADGARTVEQLEHDNAALRARVEDLLRAGTPGASVEVARKERDTAREEVQALSDALRAARAEGEALRAEADTLRASLAEAASTTAQ